MSGTIKISFSQRREALHQERTTIAAEIARLKTRDEILVREEERLRMEGEALSDEPYLVRTAYLLRKLDISPQGFLRLRNNKAKGFPEPVTYIDSDPRWCWPEVRSWLKERVNGNGKQEVRTI